MDTRKALRIGASPSGPALLQIRVQDFHSKELDSFKTAFYNTLEFIPFTIGQMEDMGRQGGGKLRGV
jgi:hypothetical protein